MARFPIVEYENATTPQLKAVYDEIIAELGFGIVPNLFKSMATNPDVLEANWDQFRATILKGRIIVENTINRIRRYQSLSQADREHRRRHEARVLAVAELVNRQFDHRLPA